MVKVVSMKNDSVLSRFIVVSVSVSDVGVASAPSSDVVVDFGGLNDGRLSGGKINDYDFVMSKCAVDKAWKPDPLRLPQPLVEYNGWKPSVSNGFVSSLSGGSDVSAFLGQLCCFVCGVPLMDLDWTSNEEVGLLPTHFKCIKK